MLKVVLAYEGSVLHSLLIDHIASNCKLTDNIGSPLSELSCSQHIYAYKSEFIGATCFVILLAHRYRKQYNKHDIVHRCDKDSRICGTPVNICLNSNLVMKKFIISISLALLLFVAFFLMLILTETPMNLSLIGSGVATLITGTYLGFVHTPRSKKSINVTEVW